VGVRGLHCLLGKERARLFVQRRQSSNVPILARRNLCSFCSCWTLRHPFMILQNQKQQSQQRQSYTHTHICIHFSFVWKTVLLPLFFLDVVVLLMLLTIRCVGGAKKKPRSFKRR
jgi:hypothetical protein